jgi:hypothetical protein
VALPLKAIVSGEPGALLAIETLPLAAPAAVGANFTVNDALEFALMVWGALSPLMLNPVPVTLAAEIVTEAVPLLVSVIFCVALLPTFTFPKLKLAGLADSCP